MTDRESLRAGSGNEPAAHRSIPFEFRPDVLPAIANGITGPVRLFTETSGRIGRLLTVGGVVAALFSISLFTNAGSHTQPFSFDEQRSFGWAAIVSALALAVVFGLRQRQRSTSWWISAAVLPAAWAPLLYLVYPLVYQLVILALIAGAVLLGLRIFLGRGDTSRSRGSQRLLSRSDSAPSPREIWEATWQNDDGTGSEPPPIIVVKTSLFGNKVWAVGVTSQARHVCRGNYYQVFGDFGGKASFAMCGDPRVLRRRDLLYRKGQLERRQYRELVQLVQPHWTS